MIYKTKKAATLSLVEFSPAMRALHKVVSATVKGEFKGFTVVMVNSKVTRREVARRAA